MAAAHAAGARRGADRGITEVSASLPHSQRIGDDVELVEPVMVSQAEGLALHLEVPPVLRGPAAQLAVGGQLSLTFRRAGSRDPATSGVELVNQRLERPADPQQRRGTLLGELLLDAAVLLGYLPPSHFRIVADLPARPGFSRLTSG